MHAKQPLRVYQQPLLDSNPSSQPSIQMTPVDHSTLTPTRPVTAVPAASGFSTTCHSSPPSLTTRSTGTTNLVPLRATASSSPTSPTENFVPSSAICQRCRPATRDSSRISVTTPENSFTARLSLWLKIRNLCQKQTVASQATPHKRIAEPVESIAPPSTRYNHHTHNSGQNKFRKK